MSPEVLLSPPETAQNDVVMKGAFNSVVYAIGDAISSFAIVFREVGHLATQPSLCSVVQKRLNSPSSHPW